MLDPSLSVITMISRDHEVYLGRRIEEIALEKAGIMREGVPIITGARGVALRAIEEEAERKGAILKVLGRDFSFREREGGFDYCGAGSYRGLEVSLRGRHQLSNASIAIASVEGLMEQGFSIGEEAIREGLRGVRWPGRCEVLEVSGKRVVLDAAHNPSGAKALRDFLKGLPYRDLYLMVGIMGDKAIRGFLRTLAPMARTVILTQPDNERAAPLEELLAVSRAFNPSCVGIKRSGEAVEYGLKVTGREDILCITGSIFLIGEVRRVMGV